MSFEAFKERLMLEGDYDCSCHINPPCNFCTNTVNELYEDYCKETNQEPIY